MMFKERNHSESLKWEILKGLEIRFGIQKFIQKFYCQMWDLGTTIFAECRE